MRLMSQERIIICLGKPLNCEVSDMLKTLTTYYIISLLIIIVFMIGSIMLYYLYYNKQINKRIIDHVKGRHLITPFQVALIIVIISLTLSVFDTYIYNRNYFKAYQTRIINSTGEFEEKKISSKRLIQDYDKHTLKTKYEIVIYYTVKHPVYSVDVPKAYVIFKPVKKVACTQTYYSVKEFKFDDHALPFINLTNKSQALAFTTRLSGTTIHLTFDQYYYSQEVINAYTNKNDDIDLQFSEKLKQKAFGKEHLEIAVKV